MATMKMPCAVGTGGGGKTYYQTKTVTLNNNIWTVDDVGFQPSIVIIITPNYCYTLDTNYDSKSLMSQSSMNWGTGNTGKLQNITPTSDGFTVNSVTSSDNGKSAIVFCYAE